MRSLMLMLVVGCGDNYEECLSPTISDVTNQPRTIASGRDFIGVTWEQTIRHGLFNKPSSEHHATLVYSDGSRSPDDIVTAAPLRGSVASETVLWRPIQESCSVGTSPLALWLHRRDGGSDLVSPTLENTRSHAVVFDGQNYQLFWITDGAIDSLQHRSLAEDGTLGPLHVLQDHVAGACVAAASDGAGTTVVQLGADYGSIVDVVDTTTGTRSRAFTGGAQDTYDPVFWFNGEFHVRESGRLFSFDATGATRTQFLLGDLLYATGIVPGDATLYVTSDAAIVEVDASLATVRIHQPSASGIGAFGSDLVRFEHHLLDAETFTPGRVELVRGDVWRRELVVDSAVRLAPEVCDVD